MDPNIHFTRMWDNLIYIRARYGNICGKAN